MKRKRVFRITFTDETSLEKRAEWIVTPWRLLRVGLPLVLLLLVAGGLLVVFTPLKRLMPGYMPSEQRSAAEMAYLRVDSLREVLSTDRDYMSNILNVMNIGRNPEPRPDTSAWQQDEPLYMSDSLIGPSENETRFNLALQRREGFNLSVLAPLAAEGMVFCFPASQGVYGQLGADGATQRVVLAGDACVRSVADGTVVGVSRSVRERGYLIWVQHDNGFLSRYSRLGNPLVDQGSSVEAGQAIALQAVGTGTRGECIDLQLWHDGEQVPPRRFVPEPM